MKRFRNILSEVAEPKGAEEKKFKDQHQVEIIDPLGLGDQEGYKPKAMPKKRLADYMKGQDETAYDQAHSQRKEGQAKLDRAPKYESYKSMNEGSYERAAYGKGDAYDRAEAHADAARHHYDQAEKHEKARRFDTADLHTAAAKAHDKAEMHMSRIHTKQENGKNITLSNNLLRSRDAHAASMKANQHNESFELNEDPSEEIPMMVGQLRFIEYAAREIEDFITDTTMDPEEWFQNKLAAAHGELKTLHAYAEGKRYEPPHDDDDDEDIIKLAAGYPMYSSYYEALEEGTVDHGHYTFTVGPKKKGGSEGAPSHVAAKRSKMNKAGIPHHNNPGEYGDTVHVKVTNNKTGATTNHHVYQRDTDKDSAEALMSTRTVGANKSAAAAAHEKALHHYLSGKRPSSLKEGVKPGMMKLKDGKSVKVSAQEAKMLNDVMKSLNPKNRKEMESTMMKDSQGFKDIIAFAKEAE